VKLKYAARINAHVLPESTAPSYEFAYVDIGAVSEPGTVRLPGELTTFGSAPVRARRLAPAGATVVSTVRTYLRGIARVPPTDVPLVFSTGFAVLEAAPGVDPGFLSYVCRSEQFIGEVVARSAGVSYPAISPTDLGDIDIPIPAIDEQRRVTQFLDGECERVERIRGLRSVQARLLDERFGCLVDGAVVGDRTALAALDAKDDRDAWVDRRVGRLCDIVAGHSFASESFGELGARLLRGVNVGIGSLDWTETAWWDGRVPERFRLDVNDLVVAMDRPWISGGLRLAFVTPADLPSVLVQRVARLRPKTQIDIRYVRWALDSGHFRNAVEGTLTGVSVPHLSADQIGGFGLRLPPWETQSQIADALERQADLTRSAKTTIDQLISTLAERRQAVITAALNGRTDVTTATVTCA
jgi:type I restriction enzyme, S subunit